MSVVVEAASRGPAGAPPAAGMGRAARVMGAATAVSRILGFGRDPFVPHAAAYHTFCHWFLYQISPKVTGVWRSEIFWIERP